MVTLKASKAIAFCFAGLMLASCNGVIDSAFPKHEKPIPEHLLKTMEIKGMTVSAPIMLRIFKEENTLEVWKQDHTKRYALLNNYEICKWSGKLGPKKKEGDRQAPEGFYHVTPGLMNPRSSYHLSFNMGYPNKYDQAHGRTGAHLMVHGACSSAGCYSMTDEYVEEIYSLARESFKGGQKSFQIQAFPFRMTAENMASKAGHPSFEFWKMLKEGSDHFEVTKLAPQVNVCEKRYVFNRVVDEGGKFEAAKECPPAKTSRRLALAFNEKQSKDQEIFDKVLTKTANNPFIKDEDKPKVKTASILADPTIGPLGILEPKPVVAVAEVPAVDAVAGNQAGAKPAGNSLDPISSEVQGGQTITASGTSATVPVITEQTSGIAVPQKAVREPAS